MNADILLGLQTALSLDNLLIVTMGCFVGTFIGMLPGLGPITAIALMIPITYGIDPSSGSSFCQLYLVKECFPVINAFLVDTALVEPQ